MPGDAVQVAPHVYTVVLENDKVRVLDTNTDAGASSDMHSHPNMVGYAISDCSWDLTGPDGTTARVEVPAGATFIWTRLSTLHLTLVPMEPTRF